MVNLYPFEATVAKAGCTLADAIENIDIGGPAMVRSAAKNWADVGVITDAGQYEAVLAELKANGKLSDKLRFALSVAAFNRIAQYDGAISDYLSSVKFEDDKLSEAYVPERSAFPARATATSPRCRTCATAKTATSRPPCTATCIRPPAPGHGRAAAGQGAVVQQHRRRRCRLGMRQELRAARLRDRQARQPRGVAVGKDAHEAYAKAFQTDPTSAFGGIIAFNRTVDKAAAEAVVKQFVEVLMAPTSRPRRWKSSSPRSMCAS